MVGIVALIAVMIIVAACGNVSDTDKSKEKSEGTKVLKLSTTVAQLKLTKSLKELSL